MSGDINTMFESFMSKFGKRHEGAEYVKRLAVFAENVKKAMERQVCTARSTYMWIFDFCELLLKFLLLWLQIQDPHAIHGVSPFMVIPLYRGLDLQYAFAIPS